VALGPRGRTWKLHDRAALGPRGTGATRSHLERVTSAPFFLPYPRFSGACWGLGYRATPTHGAPVTGPRLLMALMATSSPVQAAS